jgi:hypothetical protein
MNWRDVLPRSVADAQTRWERGAMLLRAHRNGAKVPAMARWLGVRHQRVYELLQTAARAESYGRPSPVEAYLRDSSEVREVGRRVRLGRWKSDTVRYLQTTAAPDA